MEANQSASLIADSNVQFATMESGVPLTGSRVGTIAGRTANGENVVSSVLKQSAHPAVLLFHFGFRTAAILIYLFLGWFVVIRGGGGSIFVYVLTTILLAVDFWQVKNVSGRLLVGLRWWQEQTDQGAQNIINKNIGTKWIFESRNGASPVKTNNNAVINQ